MNRGPAIAQLLLRSAANKGTAKPNYIKLITSSQNAKLHRYQGRIPATDIEVIARQVIDLAKAKPMARPLKPLFNRITIGLINELSKRQAYVDKG